MSNRKEFERLVIPGSSWTRNSCMYQTTVLAVDEHYVYFTAPWTKRGEARKMIDSFLAHYSKEERWRIVK